MARLFLLIFVALFIVHYCEAKSSGGKGRHRNRLSDEEIQQIKNLCKEKGSLCKGQKEEHKKKRHGVKNAILNSLKASGKSHGDAEKEAEEQLKKIHELKVKINEEMGISDDVDPADDGLYGGDMVLSKDHAQRLIDNRQDTGSVSKRSAADFFDWYKTEKWPSFPIHYWINKTIGWSDAQMAEIRDAIATLQSSTKCLSFVEDDAPATGDQIQYTNDTSANDTGCWADFIYRGPDSPNRVNLGRGCVYKNIVMHETIHVLGGGHEHQRSDRDQYIIYQKDNVDPKKHDAFDILGPDRCCTTYGVPYRTTSIMHYQSTAFSRNKLPTMINKATNAADIGDNKVLTPEDILQLNRMYCVTCKDNSPTCGDDALAGKCSLSDTISTCAKSCGTCDV